MVMIAGLSKLFICFLASMTLILAASYSLWLGKRVLFGLPSNDIINNMSPIKSEEFWPLIILVHHTIGVKPGIILDISLVSSEYMIDVISGILNDRYKFLPTRINSFDISIIYHSI